MECSNGTAVMLKDCTDCLVAGNTIRNVGDGDGCGVMIEGGRHNGVIGNDIHDVGSDGVLVAAGDMISLTPAEIRIDNNYIHHVGLIQTDKWVSPYFTAALYPDWAASGLTIVGNVLVRAPRACLFVHSGRDNVIENNILIDGGLTQMHWRGWTTEEGFWSTMVDGWIENYELATEQAACREVPALKDPRRVPLRDHRVMTGNVFRRNIIHYTDPHAALFTMETVPLAQSYPGASWLFGNVYDPWNEFKPLKWWERDQNDLH